MLWSIENEEGGHLALYSYNSGTCTIFILMIVRLLILVLLSGLSPIFSQSPSTSKGPLVPDYGAVFDVPNPEFQTDPNMEYRVMFDIYDSPDNPNALNRSLNTLARFLNMHAKAGVPASNLHVAAIVHNKASWDLLTDEAYQEKYGTKNPNRELIEQLRATGAGIYQCGQSLYSRGVPREKLLPGVEVGLSAMTIIMHLQKEGYQLIKF